MASSSCRHQSCFSSSSDNEVHEHFLSPKADNLLAAPPRSLLSIYFGLCVGVFRKYLCSAGEFSSAARGRHNLTIFETKCAIISLTNRELTKNIIMQKLRHFNRIREMEDLSLKLDDNAGVSLETFLLIVRDVASTELNLQELDKVTFAEVDSYNRGNIKSDDFLSTLSRIAPILSKKRGNDVFKALDPFGIGRATFPVYRSICRDSSSSEVSATATL